MKREVRELVAAAKRHGWRVVEGKHIKLYPPDQSKPPVVLPKTPSDWRALRNAIAELRRCGLEWPPK